MEGDDWMIRSMVKVKSSINNARPIWVRESELKIVSEMKWMQIEIQLSRRERMAGGGKEVE